MQEPKYYRAKLQFQTRKFKNQVKAGLYEQNSHYLVELKDCLVQDKETQVMADRLAELLTYRQIQLQMRENARCSHHHGTQSKKNRASPDNHRHESPNLI